MPPLLHHLLPFGGVHVPSFWNNAPVQPSPGETFAPLLAEPLRHFQISILEIFRIFLWLILPSGRILSLPLNPPQAETLFEGLQERSGRLRILHHPIFFVGSGAGAPHAYRRLREGLSSLKKCRQAAEGHMLHQEPADPAAATSPRLSQRTRKPSHEITADTETR